MKKLTCLSIMLWGWIVPGGVRGEEQKDQHAVTLRQVYVADAMEVSLDCREVYDVRKCIGDPVLSNLLYSAVGWEIDAEECSSRTAEIAAQAGALAANGSFQSDLSDALTVLLPTTGAGSCDWQAADLQHKVYQFVHTVKENGVVDKSGYLYGYVDFTHWNRLATAEEIKTALISPSSHGVSVTQDEVTPWQPIEFRLPGVGLESDAGLQHGIQTSVRISFSSYGTLSYDYRVQGGALMVGIDGMTPRAVVPTEDWTSCTLRFDDFGEHTVVFTYMAGGDGAAAAVRNVRWTEDARVVFAKTGMGDIKADLREGAHTEEYFNDILPLTYSSTNWIGDVAAATPESIARVTVVQLVGSDPEVTNWTQEVTGTFSTLRETSGEGTVKWRPTIGVWKAVFEILNGDTSVKREESFFDLRKTRSRGFAVILF